MNSSFISVFIGDERKEMLKTENAQDSRLRERVDKQNQEIFKLGREIQALRQVDSKIEKSIQQRLELSAIQKGHRPTE